MHTLGSDVKWASTVWYPLNEIIPVFIWVISNYTASNKPLWPHILAPTPPPSNKHMHTDKTARPHMPTTNTKWMHAWCTSPQVFTSTHALYCIHTWHSPYVNTAGNERGASESSQPTPTHNLLMELKWGHRRYVNIGISGPLRDPSYGAGDTGRKWWPFTFPLFSFLLHFHS